jgi:hypothetical protein
VTPVRFAAPAESAEASGVQGRSSMRTQRDLLSPCLRAVWMTAAATVSSWAKIALGGSDRSRSAVDAAGAASSVCCPSDPGNGKLESVSPSKSLRPIRRAFQWEKVRGSGRGAGPRRERRSVRAPETSPRLPTKRTATQAIRAHAAWGCRNAIRVIRGQLGTRGSVPKGFKLG